MLMCVMKLMHGSVTDQSLDCYLFGRRCIWMRICGVAGRYRVDLWDGKRARLPELQPTSPSTSPQHLVVPPYV